MDPLVWSLLLLVVGLLMLVAEVFVPSGGLLGFLSITSLSSSIFLAFYTRGLEVGIAFVSAVILAVPVTLAVAFRWWPKTPMGKRILLGVPRADEVMPDSPLRRRLREMVGKVGTASSVMLPSGAVLVDGITVDAVSEGTPIEAGTRIRVVDVRGNRVLVRPAPDDTDSPRAVTDDVLSQPIDSLGLDPFEDPLA